MDECDDRNGEGSPAVWEGWAPSVWKWTILEKGAMLLAEVLEEVDSRVNLHGGVEEPEHGLRLP